MLQRSVDYITQHFRLIVFHLGIDVHRDLAVFMAGQILNSFASTFRKDNKAVVAVTCELYPDPNTVSGYFWTNEKGGRLEVTNGTLVNAKVVVEEVRPITKLFVKLKDIWGD